MSISQTANLTTNMNVILTDTQAKARYQCTGVRQNGKPVFRIPTRKVLSLESAFLHKKLPLGTAKNLGVKSHTTTEQSKGTQI